MALVETILEYRNHTKSTADEGIQKCSFSQEQCTTLESLKVVINALALTAVIVTLLFILLLKKYETFRQIIVIHIMVVVMLTTIVNMANNDYSNSGEVTPGCKAFGFFEQILGIALLLWVCSLTRYLFYLIIKERDTTNQKWHYTAVCWLVPVFTASFPFITDSYGNASAAYCWIDSSPAGTMWRFVVYWIPVFIGIVGILITFIYMIYHTRKAMNQFTGDSNRDLHLKYQRFVIDYLKPLSGYAATFVVLHIIMLINRIQNAATGKPVFGLVVVHVMSNCSYGLALSTIFVATNGIKEFTLDNFKAGLLSIYYYLRRVHLCCRKDQNKVVIKEISVDTCGSNTMVDKTDDIDSINGVDNTNCGNSIDSNRYKDVALSSRKHSEV